MEEDEFDKLVLAENSFVEEGYKQGHREGVKIGWREGFSLGLSKGVELGSEIGFYKGFVTTTIRMAIVDKSNQRLSTALNHLDELLSQMDHQRNSDVVEILLNIRGKFRQVCSLMRLDPANLITTCKASF